ncbi:S41 family peptidase [uncultured Flavobacterium sp.]|uniref:S41 family peptidase n=1 Tax=uncultured Flavobacterium sp. TaxID=165435 RepID=UPI0030ED3794|tara:strand:- start:149536 stop:151110 length:1575 start_codon:yes stop_codon:yes gene_type:complete
MKVNKIYLPIIISLSIAVGLLLGSFIANFLPNAVLTRNPKSEKLNKLINFIDNEYVDNVNTDSIVDLTVNGILEKLDPHSVYIAKNDVEEVNQSMKGDFVGIGINFYLHKDTVVVIKPLKNGPSYKAGIKSGDRILFADKFQLFNKKVSNETLFAKLKGEEGSKVELTIFRKATNKKFKVNITREVVPIKSVDIATLIDDNTGYIKVNRFAETTFDEFHKAILKLKNIGATELIIDLRDNGGGYLEIASEMVDEFLKDKELIVKTINKKGTEEKIFATKKGDFETGKVTILINENSASASEVLAGAIQDNDRGIVVGRRSFGKGLVQREMPLGDGSMVRLTVARYYTPSGRSIQKPYDDKADGYFNEFEKRFLSGELYEKDSIKVADSLKFKTKNGRIVYGGGGITPDVFVPFEGKHGEEATLMIMKSGVVDYFVFEQLDKDRNFFNKLSKEELKKEIVGKDKYLNILKEYVAQNGYLLSFSTQKEKVKTYLYAEFVRQLFDEDSYYQIMLSQDVMIKKVMEKK